MTDLVTLEEQPGEEVTEAPGEDAAAEPGEEVTAEMLVEEVSIDGMCGVY